VQESVGVTSTDLQRTAKATNVARTNEWNASVVATRADDKGFGVESRRNVSPHASTRFDISCDARLIGCAYDAAPSLAMIG